MQRRKSKRHINAARARWRAAEMRAEAAREDGIEPPTYTDVRQPFTLDLSAAGGPRLTIEPRLGYVSWRALDEAGKVVHCCAMKELLRRIASDMPRQLGARNF